MAATRAEDAFAQLPPSLLCPICRRPFEDAVASLVCSHSFCRRCLDGSRSGSDFSCPIDGKPLNFSQTINNITLQEQVDEYLVVCGYPDCRQRVAFSALKEHEATCFHRIIVCPNSATCGRMKLGAMRAHLETCMLSQCRYNVLGCLFRGTMIERLKHEAACTFQGNDIVTIINLHMAKAAERLTQIEQQMKLVGDLIQTAAKRHLDNMRKQSHLAMKEFAIPFSFKCMGTFQGHSSPVWCACSKATSLFTAGSDQCIKVWDTGHMSCVQTIFGHQGVVHALTTGSNRIFSGDAIGTVIAWDPSTGQEICRTQASKSIISSLQATKKRLFVSSFDMIKILSTETLAEEKVISDCDGHWVRCLVLAWDKNLYSGSIHCTLGQHLIPTLASANIIHVRNYRTLAPLHQFHTEYGSIRSLCVSKVYIFTGTVNQNIQVYSRTNMAHLFGLTMHVGAVSSLTLSPQGCFLFSASEDGTINIWDIEKQLVVQTISRHEASVNSLTWHKGFLVSASADCSVKLFKYMEQAAEPT